MKNVKILTALVLFLIASVIYISILLLLRSQRTEEIDFIQGGDIKKSEINYKREINDTTIKPHNTYN